MLRRGENIRRRAMDDIDKARKFALEKFSSELLAVKDSLDAALLMKLPMFKATKMASNSPPNSSLAYLINSTLLKSIQLARNLNS